MSKKEWEAARNALKKGEAAFNAAVKERARILRENPGMTYSDPSLPRVLAPDNERKQRVLESYRRAFIDSGDLFWVLKSISYCAMKRTSLPEWVEDAFTKAFNLVESAHAKSWDDVFGKPYKKGTHLAAVRRNRELRWKIFEHVENIRDSHPETTIDIALFELVGEHFSIGATKAFDLYSEVKNHIIQALKGNSTRF